MYHRGTDSAFDLQEDGIAYLYSLVKWTKESPFSLENIAAILKFFEDPQDKIKTIIITGTNGKGSVSAMISSILGAAGYSVGLNISPHLTDIEERILINGNKIERAFLANIGVAIKEASTKLGIILSFHEAMTVAAFLAFEKEKVEFQVLEVGLGGRLDAANIVKMPILSILVSVDFDHEALLGDTLEKIALEKAGIFRPGKKALIGRVNSSVLGILRAYCKDHLINSICYDFDFHKLSTSNTYSTNLLGEHQEHNMAIAAQAGRELCISEGDIKKGLTNVFWPARLEEIVYSNKKVLIDAAHNPAGVRSLISYLESRGTKDISLGFGALSTKKWPEMIDLFMPFVKKWSLLTPPSETAVDSSEIEAYLKNKKTSFKNYGTNYKEYLEELKLEEGKIVIAGSIYLVGKIRSMLTDKERAIWVRSEKKTSRGKISE